MKIAQIVKELCELEGLTSEVSRGNMKEIVAIISDKIAEQDSEWHVALFRNGVRRMKRKKKAFGL